MLPRRTLLASFLAPALPGLAAPVALASDPIFPLIDAARSANALHIALCKGLDEDDACAVAACNAACEAVTTTTAALVKARPATHSGLVALVAFYAEDADGTEIGAYYLEQLLAVLKAPLPS